MRERLASHYDRIWRVAVVLLAAIGLAAAIVFIGPSTNLVAFLLATTRDLSVGRFLYCT